MGRGISLDSNVLLSGDSLKGKFGLTNPNYKNSDKSLYINAEILETDNFKTFGYKSDKKGFNIGTNFEYLDDFYLGIGTSNFYEVIETNSTASASQQSQEGNYWDSFLNLDFIYDKRNQKFQTTDGFRSFYSIDLPIISDNETLKNYYSYSQYFELFDQNISSFSLMLNAAKSISNKDIKLSERINIPSSRLRGFESGRIGPKDGDDYIGGNYGVAVNFASTIPQILEQSQNVDFLFFIDAANLWGVDYDNSLDDGGSIRSSLGFALDWYSPIGPMNFSLAYPVTKEDSDKEETFRFNLGNNFLMLYLKKILLSVICLIYLTSNLFAENKVAYIDLDKILVSTDSGKALFKQLNNLEKLELENLKNEEKAFKEEENKILSTKNLLTQDEYTKKVNAFKKKISVYQNKKKTIIDGLQKKRNTEVVRFLKMTNPLIESIMESNSIDILIEKKNVFIAKSNTDITNVVIDEINKNIKNFEIEK
jgi:Skp family chaperone for outer membrane proteins